MSIAIGSTTVTAAYFGGNALTKIYLGIVEVFSAGGFSPASLFASSEPGVWYDPSDFSTMFQDSAGTTPVTAVEQPVGRILDKSGRGNHATQTTSTSRPVLSARYNVVQKSDQPADSYWTKTNSTVVENAVYETNDTGSHGIRKLNPGLQAPAGTLTTLSAKVKANGRNYCLLYDNQGRYFDITPGTSGAVLGGYDANVPQASIEPLEDDWFLCRITYPGPATWHTQIYVSDTGARVSYAGDVTKGIYVTDIDLRPANQSSLPYQRVNTATDYDTVGFPMYLRFDGVDDWLVTPSINFTATNKVTVFAGVRKLSDAARGSVVELTTSTAANNGAFQLTAPESASATFAFISKGTTQSTAIASSLPAPITRVLSGIADIAGDSVVLRANGAQVAIDTADQGTGNFANAPMFIGRRGGTTLPFNGHIYSLIVRGAQSTAQQIASTETWVNGKTRAY